MHALFVHDTVGVAKSLQFITLPCSVYRSLDEVVLKVIESEKQKQFQN